MFDVKYPKLLIVSYSVCALIGLIVLIIICSIKISSWSSLYGWLIGIPFGIISIISYTYIPLILLKYQKKNFNKHNKNIIFFCVLMYIMRYLFYVIPIIIVVAINGFKFNLDGLVYPITTIIVILLIPLCSIFTNYFLLIIAHLKQNKEGNINVPTGDSLSAN